MPLVKNEVVILVPGVGMGGAEMLPLSWRLRRAGYQTRIFWHCPWAGGLDSKASKLKQMVASLTSSKSVHLVGHSLGGHIILRMLADGMPAGVGKVVTMGTPHMSSVAVAKVEKIPVVRLLLGRDLREACSSAPLRLPDNCVLGTMAGRLNFLLGWILGLGTPNDTVVAESEARHPSASQHILLPVSHSSMLVSTKAAGCIVKFLADGKFE